MTFSFFFERGSRRRRRRVIQSFLTSRSEALARVARLRTCSGAAMHAPAVTHVVLIEWGHRYFFIEIFDHFKSFFLFIFQYSILLYPLPLALRLRHRPAFLAVFTLGKRTESGVCASLLIGAAPCRCACTCGNDAHTHACNGIWVRTTHCSVTDGRSWRKKLSGVISVDFGELYPCRVLGARAPRRPPLAQASWRYSRAIRRWATLRSTCRCSSS